MKKIAMLGMSKEEEIDYTQAPWGRFGRNIVLGIVSGGSKVIIQGLNRFHVDGADRFLRVVLEREQGRPLFTVSNHCSTLDDPVLFSGLLPWSFYWTEGSHGRVRWSLCAREICYKSRLFSRIFQNGKTLPIDRGQGIEQSIMRVAAQRAAQGDWVHVFPEARIGYTGQLQPLKWGIGKLICDSYNAAPSQNKEPLLLPFYHSGMGRVLPKGCILPRVGNDVHIQVGEPIEISDLLPRCSCKGDAQKQAWREITERISEALTKLEQTSAPNWNQKLDRVATKRDREPPTQTESNTL